MNFPYHVPFRLDTLMDWMVKNSPASVGMNDSQYFWYTELVGHFPRAINGIPIHFLSAPKELKNGDMIT
jgi:hypothetical protein